MTDNIVRHLTLREAADRIAEFKAIYAEVYREPPYVEGEDQVADFVRRLAAQAGLPGFAVVVAEAADGSLAGFAYGLTMAPQGWWRHAGEEPDMIKGRPTFAVMELAVRRRWRGRHIATSLMTALLSDRSESFAILCANPGATARAIYRSWGWHQVAIAHPPRFGPMDVLVKRLDPSGNPPAPCVDGAAPEVNAGAAPPLPDQ